MIIERRAMSPSEAAAAFLLAAEQHRLTTDRVRQSLLAMPDRLVKHQEDSTLRDWAQGIHR